jgi:methylenetetrahydrofolate dehydrogenase (NADP+) / methenyltetrahydrofolate cyclohydrolase
MQAELIDGKKIAETIRREVTAAAAALKSQRDIVPGLAFIVIGDNPASQSYVRMKGKACDECGFYSLTEHLVGDTTEERLLQLIQECNRDPSIHGILVQLPLPKHIDEHKVIAAIDYKKDVDGFHPINVGRLVIGQDTFRPATPWGIQELLVRSNISTSGKHVVIVGRSNIVGKPVANILLQKAAGANAVVTVCHSAALDLTYYTSQADILIAAIGKAEMITGDMIKKGAVVIDVGTNRVDDPRVPRGYRLVGDVHFESASRVASMITPSPGGVGPMTIAMLMKNTLRSAQGDVHW